MNEMSILMHLLSNKGEYNQIGATKKEILQALSISPSNKNESIYFERLITFLSRYLEPLGLQIKFNPIDDNWFISYENEISDMISANPFDGKPRLAASLFCTLVCCLKNSGIGKIHEIQELRKKKHLLEDLKELEGSGYIEIDDGMMQVRLTPLIGYQLDLEKLFINLALKLK